MITTSGRRGRSGFRTARRAVAASLLLLTAGPALATAAVAASATEPIRVDAVHRRGNEATFDLTLPPRGGRDLDLDQDITVRWGPEGLPVDAEPIEPAVDAAEPEEHTVVLVMDTSGSMGQVGILAARRAAQAYASEAGDHVRIGLVSFADRATVLAGPSLRRERLDQGLARLRASGETSLYDGVVLAARQAGRDGTLVVLSDGRDTTSEASLAAAVRAVRRERVRTDVVAFRTRDTSLAARNALKGLAAAGGGDVVTADRATSLASVFSAAVIEPVGVRVHATLPPDATTGVVLDVEVAGGDPARGVQVPLPDLAVDALPVRVMEGAQDSVVTLLLAVVFFLALAAALAVALWPVDETDARRRERALRPYGLLPEGTPAQEPGMSGAAEGVLQASERFVARHGLAASIGLRLDRASVALQPHEWLVLRVCGAIAAAAAGALLLRHLVFGLLVGGLLGWVAPGLWLRVREARRVRAFSDTLPDTLHVVASALRSGFSLPQALAAAHENATQPMASELGRSLAAARIGAPLEDELEHIASRMRSEDWRWAVMAIRIQRSVGGNLAEVLMTTARTLRERAAVVRQVRALSAEGRLSAYVLISLPLVLAAVLLLLRREYLEPLWTTPLGLAMVIVAAVGMVVGWFWMRKLVDVEV